MRRFWPRESLADARLRVEEADKHAMYEREAEERNVRLDQTMQELRSLYAEVDLDKVHEGLDFPPGELVGPAWMQHPSPHWITEVIDTPDLQDDIMRLNNVSYGRFYGEDRKPANYLNQSNYDKWAKLSASVFGANNRLVLRTMQAHYFVEPLWNFELDDQELLLALKYPIVWRGRTFVGGEGLVERNAHRMWGPTAEELLRGGCR